MRAFDILKLMSQKVKVLKEQSELSWFDVEEAKKTSNTLGLLILWLKAILHNWAALLEILKSEKKMSQEDVDKVQQMKNYVEITLGSKRDQL